MFKAKTTFMNKTHIGWLFAVIALSILLVVSIILGMNGYYFSMSFIQAKSDISIGETANIEVLPDEASVLSFTFDGTYLPKEKLPQKIQISAKNSDKDLLIRVKSRLFGDETDDKLEFLTDDRFVYDGEYYYFKDVLGFGGRILFCEYIQIPEENNLSSKEKYILSILVEAVENTQENQIKWGFGQFSE